MCLAATSWNTAASPWPTYRGRRLPPLWRYGEIGPDLPSQASWPGFCARMSCLRIDDTAKIPMEGCQKPSGTGYGKTLLPCGRNPVHPARGAQEGGDAHCAFHEQEGGFPLNRHSTFACYATKTPPWKRLAGKGGFCYTLFIPMWIVHRGKFSPGRIEAREDKGLLV